MWKAGLNSRPKGEYLLAFKCSRRVNTRANIGTQRRYLPSQKTRHDSKTSIILHARAVNASNTPGIPSAIFKIRINLLLRPNTPTSSPANNIFLRPNTTTLPLPLRKTNPRHPQPIQTPTPFLPPPPLPPHLPTPPDLPPSNKLALRRHEPHLRLPRLRPHLLFLHHIPPLSHLWVECQFRGAGGMVRRAGSDAERRSESGDGVVGVFSCRAWGEAFGVGCGRGVRMGRDGGGGWVGLGVSVLMARGLAFW